jgi:C_GCAxxG_C_C family probable redox protein
MKAKEYFLSGLNCSQSVLAPFAQDKFPDLSSALKVMSPFGGGFSRTDNVCGAVSGAMAAIGLNIGHSEADDTEGKEFCKVITQKFLAEFKKQHKSLNCTDLIGYNLSIDNESKLAAEEGLFKKICPGLVESAEAIVLKLLNEIEADKE